MVPRGAGVLAGGRLAADDARSAGVIGAGPSSRRLDVLVDGRPQRVLPARDVPVRAAAGAADGARLQAVRHRVHADRRLGGRLRPDADTAGAPRLTAAERPGRACRGASRVRAQPRRRVRRGHGGRPARGRWTRRRADRHARSRCARSRCRSPTSPGPRPSSRADSAWSAPTPRCERPSTRRCGVWPAHGRAAACSRRQRPRRARAVPRSGRAAAPGRTTGSRIKASSTSRSAPAAGAITASSTVAPARPARGQNRRPLHMPGAGVVYVNDPDEFSVELLWMSPASEKRWGSRRDRRARRPRADTHAVERTVRIAAPVETTWDAIADHEDMPEWLGLGSVRRTVDGAPEPDGRGSERLLKLPGASITEQVLAYEPPTSYRYRVTKGSPFVCHQGEIRLRADGDQTELTWTIRFRPKLPGTGRAAGDRALLAARARAALRPQAACRGARPKRRAAAPVPANHPDTPGMTISVGWPDDRARPTCTQTLISVSVFSGPAGEVQRHHSQIKQATAARDRPGRFGERRGRSRRARMRRTRKRGPDIPREAAPEQSRHRPPPSRLRAPEGRRRPTPCAASWTHRPAPKLWIGLAPSACSDAARPSRGEAMSIGPRPADRAPGVRLDGRRQIRRQGPGSGGAEGVPLSAS